MKSPLKLYHPTLTWSWSFTALSPSPGASIVMTLDDGQHKPRLEQVDWDTAMKKIGQLVVNGWTKER